MAMTSSKIRYGHGENESKGPMRNLDEEVMGWGGSERERDTYLGERRLCRRVILPHKLELDHISDCRRDLIGIKGQLPEDE